jgi:hypothetical protein
VPVEVVVAVPVEETVDPVVEEMLPAVMVA